MLPMLWNGLLAFGVQECNYQPRQDPEEAEESAAAAGQGRGEGPEEEGLYPEAGRKTLPQKEEEALAAAVGLLHVHVCVLGSVQCLVCPVGAGGHRCEAVR